MGGWCHQEGLGSRRELCQIFRICWMEKQNPAGGDVFLLIHATSTFVQGHKIVIREVTARVPLPSHSRIVFPGSDGLPVQWVA